MDENPYKSPTEAVPEVTSKPRTRWRMLPAGVSGVFGGLHALAGLTKLCYLVFRAIAQGSLPSNGMSDYVAWAAVTLSGMSLLAAAVLWWRRRWLLAAIATGLGFVFAVIFFSIIE